MGVVTKQVDIAKEVDDVLSLVVHLVKEIKAGKDVGAIVAGSVQPLIEAVSGVDQVAGELQANRRAAYNSASLRLAEMVDVLLPKA